MEWVLVIHKISQLQVVNKVVVVGVLFLNEKKKMV